MDFSHETERTRMVTNMALEKVEDSVVFLKMQCVHGRLLTKFYLFIYDVASRERAAHGDMSTL